MEYDSSLAESAYKLAERWDSSRSVEISQLKFTEKDLDNFSSTQKGQLRVYFLTNKSKHLDSGRPISLTRGQNLHKREEILPKSNRWPRIR